MISRILNLQLPIFKALRLLSPAFSNDEAYQLNDSTASRLEELEWQWKADVSMGRLGSKIVWTDMSSNAWIQQIRYQLMQKSSERSDDPDAWTICLSLHLSIHPSIHPSEFESDYLSIFTAAGFAAGSAAGSAASARPWPPAVAFPAPVW